MAQPKLEKNIGFWSATAIVIGSVIGSSIFMKPATMAAQLGSPHLLLVVWIVGGIITIFGAMSLAELGTLFPETGGQYIYLKKSYGNFVAYMYGWSTMAVINTAAIAMIAFVCAEYAGHLFHIPRLDPQMEKSMVFHIPFIGNIMPLQNLGVKTLAIAIIVVLTIINYISVRFGNAVQFIATVLKTLAILMLIFGILFSGKGSVENIHQNAADFHLSGFALFAAFMSATTGAFASYDGWNNLNMVAGEIENPQRNIARSVFVGLVTCMLIYVLINLAYMYAMPIDTIAKSPLVASEATEKILGGSSATVIAILIVICTFGATNVNLLSNARIVFAMGQSRSFFPWAGRVHTRFHTPGNSVIVLCIWSCLFVLSGSFDTLADMFIFMSWLAYALVVFGLFILRKKMPDANRPYKVHGYPWVPMAFLLFTIFYLGTTLYSDITNYLDGKVPVINSVFGLVLTLAGAPFYWYFRRGKEMDDSDENLRI